MINKEAFIAGVCDKIDERLLEDLDLFARFDELQRYQLQTRRFSNERRTVPFLRRKVASRFGI